MRELNPLERDVIAEVRRSLKVEETPLFAQAIMMMRPMDDEVSPTLLLYFIIFTARKRSLGQGNIFTSVCQKFCPQRGGACSGGVWSWGCLLLGGGGFWSRGAYSRGFRSRRGCLLLGWGGLVLGGVSRPTSKGEIEGDQVQSPRPRRLLLRAVRILLECILVQHNFTQFTRNIIIHTNILNVRQ